MFAAEEPDSVTFVYGPSQLRLSTDPQQRDRLLSDRDRNVGLPAAQAPRANS
jgi:hypothetical protein